MYRKWLSSFIILAFVFVLMACQQGSSITISFNSNGGSDIPSMTFNDGGLFALPDDPDRLGYTFDGWFFDQDTLTDKVTAASWVSKNIKEDITLYAKWSINTYTITYVLNEGTNSVNNITSFTVLDSFHYINPTKEGAAFGGWYLDASFTQKVTVVPLGSTANITVYAQWLPLTYTVTWKNYDESILETDVVNHGEMPIYNGTTPVRPETATQSFVFIGWTPQVSQAVGDVVYVATYEAQTIIVKNPYDPTELNNIFGFNIYQTMPPFVTGDVVTLDYSEADFFEVYIDIFDWTEADSDAYMAVLDTLLAYDDFEESWILGDYFIYIYADDQTYPGKVVYGIGIYGAKEQDEEPTPFDPEQINAIFGFNIYQTMPAFTTLDALVLDYSEADFFEVYIDIFDWTEADADAYMALLDAGYTYDDIEESWVLGNYFIYIYADDQSYEGLVVYGIGIYGSGSSEEPVDGIYYQFNLQNTQTTLSGSYRENVNKTLVFENSEGKVTVKSSYLANITSNPPAGLSTGIIFASNVSNTPNAVAYLEINTLGNVINTFKFEIEARDNFASKLLGAKVEVFNGSSWVALENGNFYSQLSTDVKTIIINNLNATHFRLVFTGTGESSNGGQFKLYNIFLMQEEQEVVYETWDEIQAFVAQTFNIVTISQVLPELEGITELMVEKVSLKQVLVSGLFQYANHLDLVEYYLNDLIALGYVFDASLSDKYNLEIYSLYLNDDLAYAISLQTDVTYAELLFFQYDPVIEEVSLQKLAYMQTINAYEKTTFGKSGLPSTGTFNVLVIPIEINGSPFPSNYQTRLDLVFNGTSVATGWESVSSYYTKSSYGMLNLNFVISPKYTTVNSKSYYDNLSDDGDQYAIKEALLALDPTINFADYDSNQDGVIDSVIFIYSVEYDYDTNPWWAWVFAAKYGEAKNTKLDGKDFEYYMWASYHFLDDSLPALNPTVNAETYIHELGHLMGLMDYYSFTYDYGPLGGFDMMDYNVGDHGPASKVLMGWLQPYIGVSGTYEVTLESFALDIDGIGSAVIIPYQSNAFNDGNAFDEFIIIMFYTPKGLYLAHQNSNYLISDAGIAVFHVDARLYQGSQFWSNYFLYDNDGASDFFIQLLEADKNNSLPGTIGIRKSDLLTSGVLDLSTYQWHQGGSINVSLELNQVLSVNDTSVSFVLTVN